MLLKTYKKLFFLKLFFLIIWFILFFVLNIYSSDEISEEYNDSLVFILDISHSMNVQDCTNRYWVPITRLELAKRIISKQIESYDKNKYWLIIFAGTANYYIPPTLDKDNFILYLNNINTSLLPAGWTNLYWAMKTFFESDWKDSSPILITDGWENLDFSTQKNNISKLIENNKNLRNFYIIWVWTQAGWMVKYPNGEVLNLSGNIVKSSLNSKTLQNVSNFLKTSYIKIDTEKDIKPFLSAVKTASFEMSDTHKMIIEILASLFIIFAV